MCHHTRDIIYVNPDCFGVRLCNVSEENTNQRASFCDAKEHTRHEKLSKCMYERGPNGDCTKACHHSRKPDRAEMLEGEIRRDFGSDVLSRLSSHMLQNIVEVLNTHADIEHSKSNVVVESDETQILFDSYANKNCKL